MNGSASLTGCLIAGNVAWGGSGGAGIDGGPAYGGGISVGTNARFPFADASTITVADCQILGNSAVGGDCGRGAAGGAAYGGGLMVVGSIPTNNGSSGGSTATLDHTRVFGNIAFGGDGTTRGGGFGGGVDIALGAIVTTKDRTVLFGNLATTSGDNLDNKGTLTTS